MTKSELRTVTASIQARLAAIANNASKRDEIVIQQAPDPFDEVQLNAERDLTIALMNHETALVQNLKAALRRIQDGSYGTCAQCEEGISPKRLAAVPWAERCIRCQETADRDRHRSTETAGDLVDAA
jgi:DnaK suppressor protein